MKRAIWLIVAVCLLATSAVPALAATEKMSEEDILAVVEDIYAKHQARHTFYTAQSNPDSTPVTAFACAVGEPDTLLNCGEYTTSDAYAVPETSSDINALFGLYMEAAQVVTHTMDNITAIDAAKYESLLADGGKMTVLSYQWWKTGLGEDYMVYVGPVMFQSGKDVLDDTVYSVAFFIYEDQTRIWLMSDMDLVRDLFVALGVPTDTSTGARFFRDWLADLEGYTYDPEAKPAAVNAREPFRSADDLRASFYDGVPPRGPAKVAADKAAAEAEVIAAAMEEAQRLAEQQAYIDSLDIIGVATVVNENGFVNLRAKDDPDSGVVARIPSGTVLNCISVTESGWYEVVYEMESAFISPKLVDFVWAAGHEPTPTPEPEATATPII